MLDETTPVKGKRRRKRRLTLEGQRVETGLCLQATRRQDLCQQCACREQLDIGIVDRELNENSSGSTVDPAQAMEFREIASHRRQTTSQFVGIATRTVRVMLADEHARVQLITRLILKCAMDRLVLLRCGYVRPPGLIRVFLLVPVAVVVDAVEGHASNVTRR